MTKDLVDQLLEMNIHNRPIKPCVVNTYKSEIASGRWMVTNQGIGISVDMVLLDGQHRLLALKELDYPKVEMLIVWGLHKDTQRCVDLHTKRTMRDVFTLAYETKVGREVPAVCNVIYKVKTTWNKGAVPPSQAFDIYEEYAANIMQLDRLQEMRYFPAPCLAAAVWVMQSQNSEAKTSAVIGFMDRVSAGENLNRKMPEWHLRSYIESSRKFGAGGQVQYERFHKTELAIQASLNGQEMGSLRIR